jgi:pyruvate formate lyase activating enzyme
MEPKEILDDFYRYRNFLKNGGLTVTGGEPLMQMEFVIELFTLAKAQGIHTCLDTSGITFNTKSEKIMEKFNRLIAVTDLFMLDFKHVDSVEHIKLTKQSNTNVIKFLDYLQDNKKDTWIRHVVVPGVTLNDKYLYQLGLFIGGYNNIRAIDVIPYHNMAISKYKELDIYYPLLDTPIPTAEEMKYAKSLILNGYRNKKQELRDKQNSN